MSKSKKISQDALRKAMNEAKKKNPTVKRIESPLAKYTDAGQLMCNLCKSIVRSETLWPIHLNSKSHKENLASAKKSLIEKSKPVAVAIKRPNSPIRDSSSSKKVKGILKNTPTTKTGSNLPADFFDAPFKTPLPVASLAVSKRFEDAAMPRPPKTQDNGGSKEADEEKDKANPASLPEGFFDDPIMDAKVRQVEYKDPVEEEWDKFQKEMKEESAQSDQTIADDLEEATAERHIEEIEEQMRNWSRVMDLVRRKEELDKQRAQASVKKIDTVDEDDSSIDEDEDFDEFLDWRAKSSYR